MYVQNKLLNYLRCPTAVPVSTLRNFVKHRVVNVQGIASLEGLDTEAAFIDEMTAEMHGLQMIAHFTWQPGSEHAQRAAVVSCLCVFHNELLQVAHGLKPI